MKVYVNDLNEIKDVGSTSDSSLTELIINDESNPFNGWSKAKICCYKCTVDNGEVTMMTPYIDTRMIPYMEELVGKMDEMQSEFDETTLDHEERIILLEVGE